MILVVGLAPGAHGANRTGRMFTGDRSGEWLYRALFRARLADRPDSIWRGDGLRLDGAYITAAVRCAPPANKPTRDERGACRPFLEREMELFADVPVIVTLGGFAFASVLGIGPGGQPDSAGRGCEPLTVLASYHPSQQNTFTGRLTEEMFDAVWSRAVELSR
jgi:uracil-DNA glycosylase family 4